MNGWEATRYPNFIERVGVSWGMEQFEGVEPSIQASFDVGHASGSEYQNGSTASLLAKAK